jgi:hypothetical protein
MKRNAKDWITLDPIELEGGLKVDVRLNKEDGVFHAHYDEIHEGENVLHHGGKSWEGKDLEKIRVDVHEWAKKEKKLKWEPVIVVSGKRGYRHDEHDVLGQIFDRMMRAKTVDSKTYVWREWAYTKPGDGGYVRDTDLEVYPPSGEASEPGKFRSDDPEPVVMEYSAEKWLALLKLVQMEEALRKKFAEIVGQGKGKLELALERVPIAGLLALDGK